MKNDLTRPLRSTDDPIEYIPTQFIAGYAKSMGFDGIGYGSVMSQVDDKAGYNIAFFGASADLFESVEITMHTISGIEYRMDADKLVSSES